MLETTIAGSLPKPEWLAETEKLWPAWRSEGEDVNEWGIAALHRTVKDLRCTTAVHICFYGYGIEENLRRKETLGNEWRQYEEIFPALNASSIGQVSLECADSRVPLSLMGLLKDSDLKRGLNAGIGRKDSFGVASRLKR
jgi:5-methyltetrahydropteroyltriglutamate--homocysteine methyltransferase